MTVLERAREAPSRGSRDPPEFTSFCLDFSRSAPALGLHHIRILPDTDISIQVEGRMSTVATFILYA